MTFVFCVSGATLTNAETVLEVLASLERKDRVSVYQEELVRIRAEGGNISAQHQLAVLLVMGRGGAQDYTEAAMWLQRAADQGHSSAQFWLGNLYMQGMGVPRDFNRTIKWWRQAALGGDASAQYALAAAYRDGRMVDRDLAMAHSWFSGNAGRIAPAVSRDDRTQVVNVVTKPKKLKPAEAARIRAEEAKKRRFERDFAGGGVGGR
ncbi:MAG: tetratricopeptide repeat protein [Alphaproteobacteria bacterium]|nr:tetratricopeptide repeat protein [Alphaproteobacteria bacterium]MDP6874329.1 tetratricopeptide repeat protein [Alphaproteobacteria bacterium]